MIGVERETSLGRRRGVTQPEDRHRVGEARRRAARDEGQENKPSGTLPDCRHGVNEGGAAFSPIVICQSTPLPVTLTRRHPELSGPQGKDVHMTQPPTRGQGGFGAVTAECRLSTHGHKFEDVFIGRTSLGPPGRPETPRHTHAPHGYPASPSPARRPPVWGGRPGVRASRPRRGARRPRGGPGDRHTSP